MSAKKYDITELRAYIRDFFEMPRLVIEDKTDLIAELNFRDPDKFEWFLEEFMSDFGVKLPDIVNNYGKWTESSGKRKWGNLVLKKANIPHIYVSRLTFEELSEIAERKVWPDRFVRNPL